VPLMVTLCVSATYLSTIHSWLLAATSPRSAPPRLTHVVRALAGRVLCAERTDDVARLEEFVQQQCAIAVAEPSKLCVRVQERAAGQIDIGRRRQDEGAEGSASYAVVIGGGGPLKGCEAGS
jgi:hypothetical protein